MVFSFRYAQEGVVKRAPEVRASRGVWGHAPPEKNYFGGLGNAIFHFFQGEVQKSKHEKTLTLQ